MPKSIDRREADGKASTFWRRPILPIDSPELLSTLFVAVEMTCGESATQSPNGVLQELISNRPVRRGELSVWQTHDNLPSVGAIKATACNYCALKLDLLITEPNRQ